VRILEQQAKEAIIYATIITALTAAGGYLLSSSGIQASKLALFSSIKETAQRMLSPEFLGFLLCGAIVFALVSFLSIKSSGKKQAYIPSIAGIAAGIAITLALFGASLENFMLSAFLILAAAILIETAFIKKDEFRKFVSFRTASSASQKAVLIMAIGIFLSTAYAVNAEKAKYIQDFESETLKLALGSQGQGSTGLADSAADSIIQMQKQSIQQITSTSQYQGLKAKQDIEAQAFVTMIDNLEARLDSTEMKEQVKQQLAQSLESSKSIISFDTIKKQAPFIQTMEDYYWLIAAFAAFSAFMLLGNLIIANLAAAFAALLCQALPECKAVKNNSKP